MNTKIVEEVENWLIEWLKLKSPEVKPKDSKNLLKPKCSVKMVCEKAKQYFDLLLAQSSDGDSTFSSMFNFDQQWYNKFCAKALESNFELRLAPQTESLSDLLTSGKYKLENIWLAAHFGLFYKRMPDNSLLAQEEASKPGIKSSRKHISLFLTSNISRDSYPLKPIIVFPSLNGLKMTEEDKANMLIECDSKTARLTKEVMLKWFRQNFYHEARAYYEEKELLINFEIPPTILFLNESFKEYFKDEVIPYNVKVCYFSEGKETEFGMVIDTKSSIIRPFITNYLKKMLGYLESVHDEQNETIIKIWSDYDVNNSFDSIKSLINESYGRHALAFRPRMCFNCLPFFENDSQQNSLFGNQTQTILRIVEDAANINIGINIYNLVNLIDNFLEKLDDSVLLEDLTQPTTSNADGLTPAKGEKRGNSNNGASSSKAKLKKLSPSLTDIQKHQKDIDQHYIKNGIKNLEEAQRALKGFTGKPDDIRLANKQIQDALEYFKQKLKVVSKDLCFGAKQTSLDSFLRISGTSKKNGK